MIEFKSTNQNVLLSGCWVDPFLVTIQYSICLQHQKWFSKGSDRIQTKQKKFVSFYWVWWNQTPPSKKEMNVFNSSTLLIGEGRGGGEGKFTILSIRFSQLEAKREMHFRMPFCFGILRSPSCIYPTLI